MTMLVDCPDDERTLARRKTTGRPVVLRLLRHAADTPEWARGVELAMTRRRGARGKGLCPGRSGRVEPPTSMTVPGRCWSARVWAVLLVT